MEISAPFSLKNQKYSKNGKKFSEKNVSYKTLTKNIKLLKS